MGYVDSIVAAKQNASQFNYAISPNRELTALGIGPSLVMLSTIADMVEQQTSERLASVAPSPDTVASLDLGECDAFWVNQG